MSNILDDLAVALGIPKNQITILSVRIGSLIIDYQVKRNASQYLPDDAVNSIVKASNFSATITLYRLTTNSTAETVMISDAFTTISSSVTTPSSGCQGNCLIAAAAAGAGGGVAVVIGIVVAVYFFYCKKRTATSQSTDRKEGDTTPIVAKENPIHHAPFAGEDIEFDLDSHVHDGKSELPKPFTGPATGSSVAVKDIDEVMSDAAVPVATDDLEDVFFVGSDYEEDEEDASDDDEEDMHEPGGARESSAELPRPFVDVEHWEHPEHSTYSGGSSPMSSAVKASIHSSGLDDNSGTTRETMHRGFLSHLRTANDVDIPVHVTESEHEESDDSFEWVYEEYHEAPNAPQEQHPQPPQPQTARSTVLPPTFRLPSQQILRPIPPPK